MASRKIEKDIAKNSSKWNLIFISLISIIAILIATLVAILQNNDNSKSKEILEEQSSENIVMENNITRLRYWGVCINPWNEAGNMRTMERIFKSLRYEFVNASNGDDWDILWSIEQPFRLPQYAHPLHAGIESITLRREQKLNHFSGMGALVSKSIMNEINQDMKYILPSFVLPDDEKRLESFLKNNPDAKLVEKNVNNRGVKIIDPKHIRYYRSQFFYQHFLSKPFLINGHAYDVGIFVLITSFDPIRIYRFDADVLFRFCSKPYHPFDPQDVDKYVVKSGCLPPYLLPLFEENYKNYRYPSIKIFENHIREKGFNVDKLWTKIDEAIVNTIWNAEDRVLFKVNEHNASTTNMFELVRYDFMFDENMEPYVMEVNMSPNLTPANKIYEENAAIYEQMILDVLKLIGFSSYHDFSSRFDESEIAAGNKFITVNMKQCLKYDCHKNCSNINCRLCLPCISEKNLYQMREAYREHNYEGNFRRLFPKPNHYNDLYYSMTEDNKISIEWFNAKCREDKTWC